MSADATASTSSPQREPSELENGTTHYGSSGIGAVKANVPAGEADESTAGESSSQATRATKEQAAAAGPKDGKKADVIWVEWEPGEPENPYNWSMRRKYITTGLACTFTFFAAFQGTSFGMSYPGMEEDLNTSRILVTLALSIYPVGFGLAPLVTAPLSEAHGRLPVYLISVYIWLIFYIPQALATNIETVIVSRFIAGCAASTGSTLVGGTVADMFLAHNRGTAMSWFAFAAFFGSGIGAATMGYVEMNLSWRWIQWIQMIAGGALVVTMTIYMRESRGSILLSRRARRLRQETGDDRYQCKSDAERASILILIKGSLIRPMYLLTTEAVVFFFSLYAAFAWGTLYLAIPALSLVFGNTYGFNQGQIGLTFYTMVAGSIVGWLTNIWQERLYAKHVAKRGPEARLYAACAGGTCMFVGLMIFAFAQGRGHWFGPIVGLFICFVGTFHAYLAVFNYLSDCYTIYASSALAAQSFCRNMAACADPLFTFYMYEALGYTWASFLAAMVALLLSFVPYALFIWGPRIRQRSRFAKHLETLQS